MIAAKAAIGLWFGAVGVERDRDSTAPVGVRIRPLSWTVKRHARQERVIA